MTTETSTPWSGPRVHGPIAGRTALSTDVSRAPAPAILKEPAAPARTRVAEAPGRVDVLGGLSEYAGVASLNLPLGGPVRVSVQATDDKALTVRLAPGGNGHRPANFPLSSILGRVEGSMASFGTRGSADTNHDALERCVAGVVVEAVKAGIMATPVSGLVVSVDLSESELRHGVQWTPLISATLVALCSSGDGLSNAERLAEIAGSVSHSWLGFNADRAEIGCVLSGVAGRIGASAGDQSSLFEPVDVPGGVAFAAVDCGAIADDVDLKNSRTRTASMMGRALIGRMVGHGRDGKSWDGRLSRISVTDYVEIYRDRIPTKLKGAEFLERVGALDDAGSIIEPEHVYRVRSRTEHHIYEQDRVDRFRALLAEAAKSEATAALATAGEMLYASHWSYGQRCGLGSVETDLLVGALRRQGAAAGVLGARVSGRGCGGVVCVMMRDSDEAWSALRDIVRAYEVKSGRDARILRSTVPGVLVSGVKSI